MLQFCEFDLFWSKEFHSLPVEKTVETVNNAVNICKLFAGKETGGIL